MPRALQQLRIFLASPADVQVERTRLEKVVREINLALSGQGIQLELLTWETHAYPEFGTHPQAVINCQIGTDYDIFVGVLWSRVGTPTPGYLSGTLEEFERAYQKWQATPDSIILMIYFKDEPVPPSKLDATQLAQVQCFKEKLPAAGGLFWIFQTVDDFETQVRLHLLLVVQRWRERLIANPSPASGDVGSLVLSGDRSPDAALVGSTAFEDDESDLGFLDYMELMNEAGGRHTAALARMTAAVEKIGEKTRDRSLEVEALKAHPSLSTARLIFEESARDLNEFSASTQSEIPQFSQAHADLLRYLVGAAASALEISTGARGQSEEALSQLDKFTDVVRVARGQMMVFKKNIFNLPRMTVTFNKAKRRALQTMDALDLALSEAVDRNTKVRSEISDLLQRQCPDADCES